MRRAELRLRRTASAAAAGAILLAVAATAQGNETREARFGPVEEISFGEAEPTTGGAFVVVRFERATRRVFVRLTDEGKLRELTYVPPPTPHR